ncbi:unnamed protein product [Phytophthora lilii]|uniref:Unnamed protein product n=1 Tax=Phytophthora lilii TaxID=2077276 RepID=A0A9W6WNY1_9STRA|nr:unnamed protein product [Phytophthora lilii]
MAEFSTKNKLSQAPAASDLAAVIDALAGLAALSQLVYLPFVVQPVESAQAFTRSKLGEHLALQDTRDELVYWINERFKSVGVFLAQDR